MSEKSIEQYSEYPELKLPDGGFKSEIPDFLLADSSKQEIFIMENLSKLTQALEWNTKATIDLSNGLRRTNGKVYKTLERVNRLEENKDETDNKLDDINKELTENREILSDLKGAKSLFSKKWFWGGAFIIGVFVFFFVYPYLLASTTYKELITALKLLF